MPHVAIVFIDKSFSGWLPESLSSLQIRILFGEELTCGRAENRLRTAGQKQRYHNEATTLKPVNISFRGDMIFKSVRPRSMDFRGRYNYLTQ